MKLRIDKVVDHGQASERVEMTVIEDCQLHYYILADTTYTDTTHISNKLRHMHWFTPKDVKKGDQIILYTKKGTDASSKIGSTNVKYIIYWQLDINVWNNNGDAAILFELNTWKATKTK